MTTKASSPTRSCKVCRRSAAKKELERFVIVNSQLVLDRKQILPGRGYYSCSGHCATQIDKYIKKDKFKKV